MTRPQVRRARAAASLPAVLMAVVGAVFAVPAHGAWSSASVNGRAHSKATTVQTGNTPTGSASGRNVTLSWSASTLASGAGVDGYVVTRYPAAGGSGAAPNASCSGTVTGVTCTDTGAPSGSWKYSVTPAKGNWRGAESPQSASVTVASPSLTITSATTVTALPSTVAANLAGFITGQSVTYRLDNASTGTVLSATTTPTPVPANGTAAAGVALPLGTSNGTHTIYAIGSQGDLASQQITVNTPTVTATALANSSGCSAGFIKQGGAFYVYANVTGSPAGVSANVSGIASGQSSVPLTAGSYTVGGTSYNYKSAAVTANASLAAGSTSYSVTPAGASSGSGSVTVDNTQPSASDVQTTNKAGGTAGLAETGDTVVFTYSEPLDPCSIVSGWTGGSATNVVVRLTDAGGSNDKLAVWSSANTVQLPLGLVNLGPSKGDYTGGAGAVFGSTGTPSSMIVNGNSFTVTLGSLSAGSVRQPSAADSMTWAPSASAFDLAANSGTTATATETGAADKEF